jgi:hypothetical protein
VLTPWAGLNFALPANLQVFGNGGSPVYTTSYPGVSLLDPVNSLLDGVTFPAGSGGFNVGYTSGIGFAAGATQIAGEVIGINMHVITSDTAYQVIDQAWATQLFVNASNGPAVGAVPEPSTYGMIGAAALVGVVLMRRKKAAVRS